MRQVLMSRVRMLNMPEASNSPRHAIERAVGNQTQPAQPTTAPTPQNATQHWRLSVGTGSLEAARGSVHVSVNGRRISGEVDVHGRAFNSGAVASGLVRRPVPTNAGTTAIRCTPASLNSNAVGSAL